MMFKNSLTKACILFSYSALLMLIYSCKPAEKPASPMADTGDFNGYTLEAITGSSIQYASLKNAAGALQVEGYVLDGKKTGQWIEYSPEGDIRKIENYVNGLLEGPVIQMTFRNQADLRARYRNNQLEGPWIMYKYGKIVEERFYVNGKLDGVVKTYDDRTFNLRQEAQYKNGVQDGYFKYYDENGKVTLEYQYKNGEKVSGGMVEK